MTAVAAAGVRGRAAALPLALWILGLLACAAAEPTLQVVADDGRVLLAIDLGDSTVFIVRWNHSVTGVRVSDYYRYANGRLLLTDSHTPAFDAGLGHIPGRGRLESDGSHGYWILDIDEPLSGNAFLLRVGSPNVDHRLVHRGSSYSLSDLAAQRRVRIEVKGP